MTVFEKRLVRATVRDGSVPQIGLLKTGWRAGGSRQASGRRVMSVWLRLLEAHNLILREVRRDLGGVMTLPQFDVLAQLDREPDGLTLAHLSRRLLVTAGNVTGIITRLERDGLVVRKEDPADGRAYRVRLTPRGRRHLRGLVPKQTEVLATLLDGLDAEDQLALRDLLGRLGENITRRGPLPHAPVPMPGRMQHFLVHEEEL